MITPQDQDFMQQALALAGCARDAGEVPVGALLVKQDQVIGEGWNQPILRQDPTAHAEIVALRDAATKQGNYRLPGTTLYVTIEPCTMCIGAMIHARVERLVFGAKEPRAGAVVSQFQLLQSDAYNHRIDWLGGVLEDDCSQMVKAFFKARR